MRIGFDLFERATYPFRGIGRIEQFLAEALLAHSPGDQLTFLTPRVPCASLIRVPAGRQCLFKPLPLTLKQHKFLWMMSNMTRAPMDWLIGPLDVFHSADFVGPWLRRTPLVITVHDMAPWLNREMRTAANTFYYNSTFPISARCATRIITDSDSTLRDLAQWAPALQPKAVTVYPAPAADYSPEEREDVFEAARARLGLAGPYILSVGTIEPRKNHILLIRAFAALLQQDETFEKFSVVIAGKPGWLFEDIMQTIRQLGLESKVILAGGADLAELQQLYVHCTVMAYPSFYEGFGLPVVEAMACGAPVIVSTAAALTEVAGDAALVVDPRRVEDLVAALRALIREPHKRDELRQRGLERAALFSWERAARETLQVYEQAAASFHK